jgi:transposase-like protein
MPPAIATRFQNLEAAYDESNAYRYVERRAWPSGPTCPHCGTLGRNSQLQGQTTRIGTYKCYQCRKPFTVKMRTAFEGSHVRLHLWLRAIFLFAGSAKPVTAYQLANLLDVSKKTAVAMIRRIELAGVRPAFGNGMPRAVPVANDTLPYLVHGPSLVDRPSPEGAFSEQIHRVMHCASSLKSHAEVLFERFAAEADRLCSGRSEQLFTAALDRMLQCQAQAISEPDTSLAPSDGPGVLNLSTLPYCDMGQQPRRAKAR